jgi:small conductance mechanosensitive channel
MPSSPTPASLINSLPPDLRALDVSAPLTDHVSWATYSHELGALAVNLAVALLIVALTVWMSRSLSALVRRLLTRGRHGEIDGTLPSFGASITRYLVLVIGMVAALQQLGVRTTSVLAVLGAASIAVGLALQGALGNVAAGVMILMFRPYRVGHYIETAGKQGTVKVLDLFVTELATPDNLRVIVPNGKVFGDVITNWSAHDRRRVDVIFHIDPKQDLAAVLEGLKAFAADHPRVLKTPAPIMEAMALNELYAEGAARVWVKTPDYAAVRSALVLKAQALSRTS